MEQEVGVDPIAAVVVGRAIVEEGLTLLEGEIGRGRRA